MVITNKGKNSERSNLDDIQH